MELIDRYVHEVGTYLPRQLQEDVKQELRSNLEEALETALAEDPSQSTEDVAATLLRELGPPHRLAESYLPKPNLLFGPRLYPAFIRTMKIAVAVVIGLAALGLFLDLTQSMSLPGLAGALIAAVGRILTGSLVILGIAVVVFSIIERTADATPTAQEDWDPRSLPVPEDPDKIAFGDQVASIFFLVVALTVLNVFRDQIGAQVSIGEERGWIPFLGPAFEVQLWLLNTCLTLDLGINLVVLLRWRWSASLRWANFAINALYVTWLWRIASGPSIIEADPSGMLQSGWSAEAAERYREVVRGGLERAVALSLRIGSYAAVVGLAIQFLKLLRRFFARR